ncbi:hypothetical protein ACFPRL_11590 [Pseudoclavibacter helvolus]
MRQATLRLAGEVPPRERASLSLPGSSGSPQEALLSSKAPAAARAR